ncbi:MAG TPA: phosphoribosylanthranilate isomerase [Bacteroidota bacterium]|nr:phosphoribosylanthranilate isomerase [Bacteroidota bacterium]
MDHLFIKICGITNIEDALAAADFGADAIGLNFYSKSPRFVSPEAASSIVSKLPKGILAVGVFVNAPREYVERTAQTAGLGALQFSGTETPEQVHGFGLPAFKAIHIAHRASLNSMKSFHVHAYLLDTLDAGKFGGTGKNFDWQIAKEAGQFGKVIVAGGLNPDNVATVIETVAPYGVDVSSGVEETPRKKDRIIMKNFILRARAAQSILSEESHG